MKAYMMGLALSQFLWPNHYEIYRAFETHLKSIGPNLKSYLEIGPGHGLFLLKVLEYLPPEADIHAVDISAASIDLTRSIIQRLKPLPSYQATFTSEWATNSMRQKQSS